MLSHIRGTNNEMVVRLCEFDCVAAIGTSVEGSKMNTICRTRTFNETTIDTVSQYQYTVSVT